ncbi:MAG TPA: prolipoprotein diacylglyceryl transferase family protein [Anaerolineales bacterium]
MKPRSISYLGGILGARLFHVLDQWSNEFAANPIRALYIWEGGLAIWGAVAGGLATAALIAWKRKWNFPALLDAAAPGLVLAQAVGRIACVITGDAMGKPTNGPFGFAYSSPNALVPKLGVYYSLCLSMKLLPTWESLSSSGNYANATGPTADCFSYI